MGNPKMNEIVVAIISLAGIVITSIINNSLVKWRIQSLENKVDKHNQLIERMYVVETEVKDIKEHLND